MGKRVLVVEDNPVLQKVVQIMCVHLAINADVVNCCHGALQLLRRGDLYQIIFMDNRLPDGSGCDCVRDIRIFERTHGRRRTPIIAMTGDCEERVFFVKADMDDLLAKPFSIAEFSQMVQRWTIPPGGAADAHEGRASGL